jgi:hypothetical protein
MIENSGNSIIFYWHYTTDGVSTTGLTVTADVYEVARDGTATLVVDDGACTEVGAGIYRYLLASGTVDAAAEYIAVAHTATDTVDAQDIPAMWVIDRAGTEKLDTGITLADDAITASKFDESTAFPLKSADTGSTQVARVGADSDTLETLSDEIAAVKAETAAILVDTGTTLDGKLNTIDGIVDDILVDTSTTLDGKLNTIDGIVDSILADTNEVQAELADGGRTDLLIDGIKAKTDLIPASPAEAGEYTAAIAAVKSVADDILVDTGTTLDALIKDIPTNAELATALGTADDAVLAAVAAAKTVIDNIHDTDLPAVKAETALIVEDTGTTIPATLATITGYTDGIAGDVWSHATRTLTVPAVAAAATEDGTTLTLYKDADINIEFTGLTIPTGAKKVVFTIKDNLDDADTASALQATYQLTAVPAETHTLNYINSATPPTLTNPVTFTVTTDSVEFDMTAAAAYYLPRYERGYLKWDLKLITATTVQILQQGLVQILGTSTRTVA